MTRKVKILVGIASANWSYAPGQIVELDEKLAKAWITAGIAEGINTPETAAIEPPEKAVLPTAKRKAVK